MLEYNSILAVSALVIALVIYFLVTRTNEYNRDDCFETPEGYIKKRLPNGKSVFVHRLIAEEILKRKLLPGEEVHHINGKPGDNHPSNLCVMWDSAHKVYHSWYIWVGKKHGSYPSYDAQIKRLRQLDGKPLFDYAS